MSYQNILAERVDKVAIITLNRPEKLNAMSYELACDLDAELGDIEKDDGVAVVILTGAGEAFIDRIDAEGFDFFSPRGQNLPRGQEGTA